MTNETKNIIFVVYHLHVHEGGEEDIKMMGVYSTREKAESAVERMRLQPGFCVVPDGFFIDSYRLDQDNWAEGYITAEEALKPFDTEELDSRFRGNDRKI